MVKKTKKETVDKKINPFQGKAYIPDEVTSDGDRYEEPERTIEGDMSEMLKIKALEYGDLVSTISKLEEKISNEKIEDKKNLDSFVCRAFPTLVNENVALEIITYLISKDQYSPTSWFNAITQNNVSNKLDLIQSIIKMSRGGLK